RKTFVTREILDKEAVDLAADLREVPRLRQTRENAIDDADLITFVDREHEVMDGIPRPAALLGFYGGVEETTLDVIQNETIDDVLCFGLKAFLRDDRGGELDLVD